MYKIGMSTCGFALTEENFKALQSSHIDAVELSMPASRYPDIDYAAVKRFAAQSGVELWSFHLPFDPFEIIDISSPDAAVRQHTVSYWTELMGRASDIGINKFIVHASGEPIAEADRDSRMQYAKQSLDGLAETAHRYGAVIAVEDLPRTCLGRNSNDIAELIGVNDKLRVCFDTNHLLGEDNVEFVKRLGDKIITTHVSDYDFLNERHWLPGEGRVDWNALFAALNACGYSGIWLYEISLACPSTIVRNRDLTFDDFRQNALSVFAGQQPRAIGTPKEGLGR